VFNQDQSAEKVATNQQQAVCVLHKVKLTRSDAFENAGRANFGDIAYFLGRHRLRRAPTLVAP